MDRSQKFLLVVTTILTIVVQLDSVSVNPALCPTNKIAPHRRRATREVDNPRTLGLIYSLLTPNRRPRPPPPINDVDDLQEQPQEDDPDDCGEIIDDYDETDLSAISASALSQVYGNRFRDHRFLFGNKYPPTIRPPYPEPGHSGRPPKPPNRPSSNRPPRPSYPAKPSYSSGGIFGGNVYRPPSPHYPTNHVKPVHEDTYEAYDRPQAAYRPQYVGGPVGHVIGFPPKRPPVNSQPVTSHKKPISPIRFPENDTGTRHPRDKQSVAAGIIGSFVDLLIN